MTTKRDYYEILGVPRDSTAEQLKDAYRTLAMKFHPDKNKDAGAEDRFKEISEAYAVLSDAEKRATYDQYGHSGFDQRYSQEEIFRNVNFNDIFREFGFQFGGGSPLEDMMFSSMFGGSGGRQRGRGHDLRYDMQITLEDASKGVSKEVSFRRNKACPHCSGSGGEPGSKMSKCAKCDGHGQVRSIKRMGAFGNFTSVVTCTACRGQGERPSKPCNECNGHGIVEAAEKLMVDIPAGVDSGAQLRLAGLGERGPSASGDLYVFVQVLDHNVFTREGDDIYIETPIGFAQAALGADIEVPTLSGKAKLTIPPGTQTHTVFRMKGEGMPHVRGRGKGDELVRVIIRTPSNLSEKQKKAISDFGGGEEHKKGIFDQMFR